MTDVMDMLSAVVFIGVPVLVGTALLAVCARWMIGLFSFGVSAMYAAQAAQAEAHNVRLDVQYKAQMQALEVQQRALQVDLVRPDHNGLMPLPRAALDAYPQQLITLMSQHIDAHKALPVMPQQLHYAPHFAASKGDQPKALEVADLPKLMEPEPQKAKDFWQLYHADQLPVDKFLIGFDTESGEPVTATWRNLYSAMMIGQSGSGKSTLLRSILAQAAMQGSRFAVIDPHLDAGEESLAHSLLPIQPLMALPAAGDDKTIGDTLKFVTATAKNRLAGKDQDRTPLILIVDETTAILARGNCKDELLSTLGLIAQESRKVGVYAICLLQQAQAELFPSIVRNSFVSYLATRARRDSVRCATGSTTMAKIAEELTIGEAAWMTPAGEMHRVAVPNCTEKHLTLVAKSLGNENFDATPVNATSKALPNHFQSPSTDTDPERVEATNGSHTEGDGKSSDNPVTLKMDAGRIALVRALIKAGKTKPEILREVWGVDSRVGGRKYQTVSADYDQVIMSIVKGL